MIQVSENSKCKTDDDNYSSLARVYHVAHDDARSDKPRCSCSTRHGNIAYESTILHGGANKRSNRNRDAMKLLDDRAGIRCDTRPQVSLIYELCQLKSVSKSNKCDARILLRRVR